MDSNMNKIESKKLDPSLKQRTEWLAENQSEMDHSFQKTLKLIEESTQSLTNSAELVAGIDESKGIELVNDSDRDQDDSFSTPNSKMSFTKFGIKFGSMDSGNDSSDPSSPASESESESYYSTLNHNLISPAQRTYKVLMDQIVKNEEELRVTNLKFQSAEEEVETLKKELETRGAELEEARREIKIKTENVEMEKERGIKLQNQVSDMKTRLSDRDFEIRQLMIVLEASKRSLETCDKQILSLREELHDCKQNFSMEKSKLETDINSLLEKQSLKETQFNKLKLKHDLQESKLKYDIDGLLEDQVILKREFDELKLKFVQMAAELDSRDVMISQMDENQNEIFSKLRLRVQELEKEVEEKIMVISEGEEKKIEAIRQLCFSLDHYRTGYRQLVRSLSGLKQCPVRFVMKSSVRSS